MKKSTRYSSEIRERAVRMVFEQPGEHDSQWTEIASLAARIGRASEKLRKWVPQAERDPALSAEVRRVWEENFRV